MRKIALLPTLFLLGASPPAQAPVPPPQASMPIASISRAFPECRSLAVAANGGKALFQRLGELPPASAYQAVLRAGPDGCPDPVIASYGHGSPGGPTPVIRR